MNDYKPYQEEWESNVTLREFIISTIYNLGTFENNLVNYPINTHSKEDWMSMFLLWSEYKK